MGTSIFNSDPKNKMASNIAKTVLLICGNKIVDITENRHRNKEPLLLVSIQFTSRA